MIKEYSANIYNHQILLYFIFSLQEHMQKVREDTQRQIEAENQLKLMKEPTPITPKEDKSKPPTQKQETYKRIQEYRKKLKMTETKPETKMTGNEMAVEDLDDKKMNQGTEAKPQSREEAIADSLNKMLQYFHSDS